MRVSCTVCGVTVAASYPKARMVSSHGICIAQSREVDKVGGREGGTYVVSLPKVLQEVKCPV